MGAPNLIDDELDLLATLVPLAGARLVEAGCGAAALARSLVQRHAGASVAALEVDERQHAKNLAQPAEGLHFVPAPAQHIPFDDATFDGALMLKSLHHVPVAEMDAALQELARVLRPGGWLYVSEPVYAGALNDLIRPFNDERVVRQAAQDALDRALDRGPWRQQAERRFEMPVRFDDFADFERRMMRPTFADHRIDDAMRDRVRTLYTALAGGDTELRLTRPQHARLLRRRDDDRA